MVGDTTSSLKARAVLVDVMDIEKVCNSTVSTIGDVISMLAIRPLLVTPGTDLMIFWRSLPSHLHAPAVLLDRTRACPLAIGNTLKGWYARPVDVFIVASDFLLFSIDLGRSASKVGTSLIFGWYVQYRCLWC